MATITKGYTFGATEQLTNAKLHTLVDSATIASIAQTDITTNEGLVHTGTTAPTDTDQLWVDTNLTPYTLKFYDGNNWVPVAEYGVLTNKSGQSLGLGRVVIVDTSNDNAFKVTSTAADTKYVGVLLATVADNAKGVVASNGFGISVLTEISASAGTFLRTSTATGKAEPVAFGTGVFGILTSSASGSGTAKLFGLVSAGANLTDTNTWTGTNTFSGNVTLNGITTITTASASTTNWQPIVQVVNTITGASASGTTTMPDDDTVPQNNEGDQYMSLAITPKHSNNILEIDIVGVFDCNATGTLGLALFQDTTANALAASQHDVANGNPRTCVLKHYMTAGTTSSTTFKLRAGLDGANTTTFNGEAAARKLGGVMASSITIKEYKAT